MKEAAAATEKEAEKTAAIKKCTLFACQHRKWDPCMRNLEVSNEDPEQTPSGTIMHKVRNYDTLLQDIADSPKSVYMGGGRTPAYIGRQKYKADQQKVKQQAANRKKSAKVYDKISAALTSPDSKLLTKNQLKELTMLFAQTSRPSGSEVSGLNPKVLSDQFQKVQ